MEALKKYMASLSPKEKIVFAELCGTTLPYLRKVMSTNSSIGPEICAQLEIHSGGAISRKELNPQNWARIWPELSHEPSSEA